MKRLGVCLIVGLICVGIISITAAQQGAGKGKTTSRDLPPTVCKAIEGFVAKIDAARSVKDKAQREKKYAEAQSELAAALDPNDKASVLTQASAYSRYTELVASADPMEPGFDELLQERLDVRAALLDLCSSYTVTR